MQHAASSKNRIAQNAKALLRDGMVSTFELKDIIVRDIIMIHFTFRLY